MSGLIASFEEARRAQALGAILRPEQPVHRYAALRVFDLFKEGEPVDGFVTEVIGRLLEQDRRRRTHNLATLQALFGAALNRKVAARRLGIHPNTLSNRLGRIEALLGARCYPASSTSACSSPCNRRSSVAGPGGRVRCDAKAGPPARALGRGSAP